MNDTKELPDDLNTCHEVILVQSEAINDLIKEREKLKRELEESDAAFKKLLEGNRREKFINPDQTLLQFPDDKELQESLEAARKEAEKELEEITYTRTKQPRKVKPRSLAFPAHLRREENIRPLSPEDQQIADAGCEVTRQLIQEVLCFKRPELYVKAYYQMVLQGQEVPSSQIQQARLEIPAGLGDQGRFDASIAAAISYGKFASHNPYYRLQDIFASQGLTLSRSTLDYTQDLVAEATGELPALMAKAICGSTCVGLDDTSLTLIMPREVPEPIDGDLRTQRLIEKMLEAKKENKASLSAKMWAYSGAEDAPYDVFDFRVSRHRDGPAEFLAGYKGHVMADCYSGNLSVILDKKSSMTRMACWAHARRKVFEAKDNDRSASTLPLALIGQLYDIERRAMEYTREQRTEVRQRESRVILDRLRTWLDGRVAKRVLPSSKLGGALQYIRNHWEALTVYVVDGRLPIDNNWVERLMKRVAIGRKNWLFVGSVRAGMRNASIMTMVASAHRHDLDVQMYLEDVITHMNRGTASPRQLLPDIWKQSHPEAVRVYREEERRDKAEQSRLRTVQRIAGK